MFSQSTKKVVKPLVALLIISSICNHTFGQKTLKLDSVALKKEIDAVLAKYGLKSTGFAVNVISLNQNGGQTAYSITNNYYQNITVSQQPELNEWYKEYFMRHIDQVRRDSAITSKDILINIGNGSNAGKFVYELRDFLKSKGYEVNIGTSLQPFTGVGVSAGKYFDNVTKVIWIYVGNISN